ncbi:hypothetical protein [Roseburia sp. MSJ-14]|uniref:hypothetical protein n=1 Tax=Roseburia sp. MSJ-14 TaxID=2841514 RepID=UPI001C11D82E|nr:hypothetical protein [Roseburia sp. MSJ-14]MBU5472680.1 hypothetical protein [Roseburia sp. MSJ-14]
MNPADLLNNPQLQNISPEKLALLMNLAQNNSPKETPQEMAESLKNASETAQKQGINFSSNEREMIVEVLKQNMSPQEQKKVDLLMQMLKNMKR